MAAPDHRVRNWPARYEQLLASSGLKPGPVISGALPPHDQEHTALLSLAQCLEQPDLLKQQLRRDHADANDARFLRAYLSVVQQDLALSVIAPLVLVLFRDGRAPLPDTEQVLLGPGKKNGPLARWFHTASAPALGVDAFIQGLSEQVSEWYPVFRQALGVSPGAYWSSIGLGLGAPFSAVWNRVEAESVCSLAQVWLTRFECDANRFIDWLPAEFGGQSCAIPQRKGCCLKYLLPDGGYCGTCGVYRKARLAGLRSRCPAPGQWQPER